MARKILLADDSVTAQNMGRKILSDAGYEVIAVNNGSAALKKIAEHKPDLVILDVYMPGYSGLEVCQRLKDSQDTARIPVLLTVGKLEPFKPEEAQRVRAEGYIVKPFEASELLSALSKLEDKVVPRTEPSRPGRFARAIASVEAASRGRATEPPADRRSESRIGFPHKKTAPEEVAADESSFYNPMNRDLRTVVETPAEKAAHQKTEEKVAPVLDAPEPSVDLAALAPEGLPHSVTPEEVFAIAAAAAQIQMAEGAFTEAQRAPESPSEFQITQAQVAETPTAEGSIAETADAPNALSSLSMPASLAEDEPVTMAAAAESISQENSPAQKWTAVSVALEGDESSLSLEHEMQKAHAGNAVADFSLVASMAEEQAESAENAAGAEAHVVTASAPELKPLSEPVVSPEPIEQPTVQSSNVSDTASFSGEANHLEAQALDANASTSALASEAVQVVAVASGAAQLERAHSASEFAEDRSNSHNEDTAGQEINAPAIAGASEQEGVGASHVQGIQELQAAPETETVATAEAVTVSDSVAAIAPIKEAESHSNPDLDTVKSTAAAWASWRQIRDTSTIHEPLQPQTEQQPPVWSHAEVEEVQSTEIPSNEIQSCEIPVPSPIHHAGVPENEVQPSETQPVSTHSGEFNTPAVVETSAWAVAAGAEQIPQEVSSTASINPSDNPVDEVASIVDSVLADLRPKLMAEIARKMAEKK